MGEFLRSCWRHTCFRALACVNVLFLWGKEHFDNATAKSERDWLLHEILLAGWGMPIGELFDLEKLAEHCRHTGRWSFFLSSEVCNVPGGVAR